MHKKVKWSFLIILIGISIMNVSCQSDIQDKITAVDADYEEQDMFPEENVLSQEEDVLPQEITVKDETKINIDTKKVQINTPKASGTVVYGENGITVDASHASEGYLMIRHTDSQKRIKVRILKGDKTYTYDLNNQGEYEVYPLQMGSGTYQIRIMENVEGTSYGLIYQTTIDAAMKDEKRVFQYPNQYAWFIPSYKSVLKSLELCKDLETEEEKVLAIYDFVANHVDYDYQKAKTVQRGYLPNPDETLATGKGICFDYSVLMAAMIRTQDIPVKVVIGNVVPENILHAWNRVYLDGKWELLDATFHDTKHDEEDYTEERLY